MYYVHAKYIDDEGVWYDKFFSGDCVSVKYGTRDGTETVVSVTVSSANGGDVSWETIAGRFEELDIEIISGGNVIKNIDWKVYKNDTNN